MIQQYSRIVYTKELRQMPPVALSVPRSHMQLCLMMPFFPAISRYAAPFPALKTKTNSTGKA